MTFDVLDSPIGPVLVAGDDRGLTEIRFLDGEGAAPPPPEWTRDATASRQATEPLRA